MSDLAEAALAAAPGKPVSARAARLEKFKREQRIVDSSNRGVAVAEIAAQVGVGEKRMRAIIREILARRMPAPPAEFAAIQVSRLNEALLVAYSAMGDMNLKAVDRVVRIVRELDRYHGFVASGRRWSERRRGAGEGVLGFGRPLGIRQGLAPEDLAEIAAQRDAMSPRSSARDEDRGEPESSAVAADRPADARLGDVRPEIPPQAPEKADSAPAVATTAKAVVSPDAVERTPVRPAPDGRADVATSQKGEARSSLATTDIDPWFSHARRSLAEPAAADAGPENPAQHLENMDFTPGLAPGARPSDRYSAGGAGAGRRGLEPGLPAGRFEPAAAASDGRPEKSWQGSEIFRFAPG